MTVLPQRHVATLSVRVTINWIIHGCPYRYPLSEYPHFTRDIHESSMDAPPLTEYLWLTMLPGSSMDHPWIPPTDTVRMPMNDHVTRNIHGSSRDDPYYVIPLCQSKLPGISMVHPGMALDTPSVTRDIHRSSRDGPYSYPHLLEGTSMVHPGIAPTVTPSVTRNIHGSSIDAPYRCSSDHITRDLWCPFSVDIENCTVVIFNDNASGD